VSKIRGGISEQDISKLFQFFYKIDNKETGFLNKSGIGLGLAISQNLIRSLNNNRKAEEIMVSSIIGKGSIFYFELSPMRLIVDSNGSAGSIHSKSMRRMTISDDYEVYSILNQPKSHMKCVSLFQSGHFPSLNEIGRQDDNINLSKKKNILVVDDDQLKFL
jgi:hypothetical protein